MKYLASTAALAAALLAPLAAQAQELVPGAVRVSPMFGLDFTGGGKTLADVQYQDGSTQKIRSGGTAQFYVGGELRQVASPIALQATIGYHYDTTTADNGDVTFSRVPFELLGMFNVQERFRLGAGLRYDSNVHMGASGAADSPENHVKFDNAAGLVLKAEYMVFHEVGLEVKYVNIRYKATEIGGQQISGAPSIDASHFGIGMNYHFR